MAVTLIARWVCDDMDGNCGNSIHTVAGRNPDGWTTFLLGGVEMVRCYNCSIRKQTELAAHRREGQSNLRTGRRS